MFKSVDTRTTTATRAGCARRGLGRNPHFSRRGGPVAEDDLRLSYTTAEHLRVHRIQDQCFRAASLQEQGTRHRPSLDPLHYRRQASDSHLLTSWVSAVEDEWLCHALSMSNWNGHWSIGLHSHQRLSGRAWTSEDKIINVYKPNLATYTIGNPDFATPQYVCWRLQLPAGQMGSQCNI